MKELIKISKSSDKTKEIAYQLGLKLKPPMLIGLSGQLGAGKTVFAKGIAEALEVEELVTSPTFLGISEYYSGRFPFIHMDFYKKVVDYDRIQYFLSKPSVVLIEWVDNFHEVMKSNLDLGIHVIINSGNGKEENEQNRKVIIQLNKKL